MEKLKQYDECNDNVNRDRITKNTTILKDRKTSLITKSMDTSINIEQTNSFSKEKKIHSKSVSEHYRHNQFLPSDGSSKTSSRSQSNPHSTSYTPDPEIRQRNRPSFTKRPPPVKRHAIKEYDECNDKVNRNRITKNTTITKDRKTSLITKSMDNSKNRERNIHSKSNYSSDTEQSRQCQPQPSCCNQQLPPCSSKTSRSQSNPHSPSNSSEPETRERKSTPTKTSNTIRQSQVDKFFKRRAIQVDVVTKDVNERYRRSSTDNKFLSHRLDPDQLLDMSAHKIQRITTSMSHRQLPTTLDHSSLVEKMTPTRGTQVSLSTASKRLSKSQCINYSPTDFNSNTVPEATKIVSQSTLDIAVHNKSQDQHSAGLSKNKFNQDLLLQNNRKETTRSKFYDQPNSNTGRNIISDFASRLMCMRFGKPNNKTKPTSLRNTGVNCYLNSALQGISACSQFVDHIVRLQSQYSHLPKLRTFTNLIEVLSKGKSSLEISKNVIFSDWSMSGQQDSYELLAYVINQVYNEMKKELENKERIPKELHKWLQEPLPMRLVMGFEIYCDCRAVSSTPLQSDLAFHVTIMNGKKDLQSLLDLYFAKDPIENYDCDKCFGNPANRVVRLYSPLPATICIHLQRLQIKSHKLRKIKDKITFSDSVTLRREYCKEGTDTNNGGGIIDRKYKLRSVIVHRGGTSSGHYICYKWFNGDWYYTSDSSVHKVTWDKVASCQAYIFFFELATGH